MMDGKDIKEKLPQKQMLLDKAEKAQNKPIHPLLANSALLCSKKDLIFFFVSFAGSLPVAYLLWTFLESFRERATESPPCSPSWVVGDVRIR
jgi:hypothetical protein